MGQPPDRPVFKPVRAGQDPAADSPGNPPRQRSSEILVGNPLRENITASLAGTPVTDLDRTATAQRFLKMVKGWRT
jgi:hypothetical protein